MRYALLLCCAVLLSVGIYREAFGAYFFQDDWFTLRISQAQTSYDFFRFFVPRSDVIYYRPLGMQVVFFVLYRVFGLNSLPFHLFMVGVIAGISVLAYYLYYQLTDSKENAVIGAFLIATSAIHFIPFFWASTMAFPFGFFFILAALFSYLCYTKTGKWMYLAGMIGSQVLGLLTNEQALLIVPVIFFHMIFLSTFRTRPFLLLFPFPLAYIVLRLSSLPSLDNTYALSIGISTVKAAGLYVLWLLNWPDELQSQLNNILVGNTTFFTTVPWLTVFLSILTVASAGILANVAARIRPKEKKGKNALFYLSIAILGMIMPLAFPHHTYAYYLHVSAFGAYGMLAMGLVKFSKIVRYGFLVLWLIASEASVSFSSTNHWAVQRSNTSKIITQYIVAKRRQLEPREAVQLPNDPNLKIVFSDQEAFRIIYNDEMLKTNYYGVENPIWKNAPIHEPEAIRGRLEQIYIQ